jgi:hypothetical protein
MANLIYAGQGPIYIGDWNETLDTIENEVSVGCGNRVLKLSLERSTEVIKESCSGQRLDLAEHETEKSATLALEMQEFSADTLAMAMYGASASITGSTVASETLPTMVAAGFYHTKHPKISAITVTDSALTPATLVLDTDYSVDDADYGRLKILQLSTYTQPFKVAYTYATRKNIKPFSVSGVIKALRFDGISTVDNQKYRVLLPKISFSPTSEFGFLSDEAATLVLEGRLLMADVSGQDPVLGKFGNVELL